MDWQEPPATTIYCENSKTNNGFVQQVLV